MRTTSRFKGTLICLPGVPACAGSSGRRAQESCPAQYRRTASTHIRVSVSEHLVQDMAELPAEDGATGKRQTNGVGPEGEGPLLVVSAQNDSYQGQGQVQEAETQMWGRLGGSRECSSMMQGEGRGAQQVQLSDAGGRLAPHPRSLSTFSQHPSPRHVCQSSPKATVFCQGQENKQGQASGI